MWLQSGIYADDINILGDNINTINENTEELLDTGSKAGLEVNAKKNKYTFMSLHQNAEQNSNMQVATTI